MLLVRQGRLVEGELELRRALTDTLRRTGRYSSQTASMLRTLATIIDEQGRHAEAEKLVWLVLDLYEKLGAPGDSFELAKTYHQLAQVLVSQGQWKASLVVFDQIKTGLADDPQTFEKTFGGDLGWSLALLSTGRTAEGASIAEVALRRSLADLGEKHYRTALAGGVLAMASANTDERKKALAGCRGHPDPAQPLAPGRRRDDEPDGAGAAPRPDPGSLHRSPGRYSGDGRGARGRDRRGPVRPSASPRWRGPGPCNGRWRRARPGPRRATPSLPS